MKRTILIAILCAAAPAYAQQAAGDHGAHHPAPAQGTLVDGEVRKVDLDAQKITLRHGPIPNLDMPAMTMVFQVKAGDKVRFAADKIGGAYTVTRMETTK